MRNKTFLLFLLFSLSFGADWTIIFYLDGDNNLSQAAGEVLEKVSSFGRNEKVKIVALIDLLNTNPCLYEISNGEKRLLANLPEKDLTDINFFREFLLFCRNNYPAKEYLLILYNHGNGWYPRLSPGYKRAILYDASSGNSIGVANGELNKFLSKGKDILGKRFGVIGFDACLMGEIEVLFEIKDFAKVCLASPSLIPIDAWDYEGFLDTLEKNPKLSPKELGRVWVELIRKKGSKGVYSAYDLDLLNKIDLTSLTEDLRKKENLKERRKVCSTYPLAEREPSPEDGHIDLIHLLNLLNIENQLKDVVLDFFSFGYPNSFGLGVWFPFNYGEFKNWYLEYLNLSFNKEVKWADFLYRYYQIFDIKPKEVKLTKSEVGAENEFTLFWTPSLSFTLVTYHLYSFASFETTLFDQGDSLDNWEGDWTIAQRGHSRPSSFYSGSGINLNKVLSLKEPIKIPEGGLLFFWSYYETEEFYLEDKTKRDILYIEISEDRVNWEKVDSIYGRNLSWQKFSYLLPQKDSVWLRFRYQSDSTFNLLGVFLDDITILSLSRLKRYGWKLKDTLFFVFNQPKGRHHFFIIPEDSFGNKGLLSDFLIQEIENPCRPFSFPSPFFSETKIFLDLPTDASGTLLIIDLLGRVKREIRFLGREAFFDGNDKRGRPLPSGLYFILAHGRGGKITKFGNKP